MDGKVDALIERLKTSELPSTSEICEILDAVKVVFGKEPNVLRVAKDIVICGDSHGQLYDVMHLFDQVGYPGTKRYIFCGDYVDRGYYSTELACLLFCYKLKFPGEFFMLRGNHETRSVNKDYGFFSELEAKIGEQAADIWDRFNLVFDRLPIAAIVDNRLFCVHGGLDPALTKVKQLDELDRRCEPDLTSILGGILWADPKEVDDWIRSDRRAGYLFNEKHVTQFLRENGLKMVVRSHEVVDGHKLEFKDQLVTIWSAPNYNYVVGNKAGVLVTSKDAPDSYFDYDAMPNSQRKKPPIQLLVRYAA